jgi:hypothetical protein
VKTTVELPDDLMDEVKLRALQEHITLKDFLARAARNELTRPGPAKKRVAFPLIPAKGKKILRSMTNAEIEDLLD